MEISKETDLVTKLATLFEQGHLTNDEYLWMKNNVENGVLAERLALRLANFKNLMDEKGNALTTLGEVQKAHDALNEVRGACGLHHSITELNREFLATWRKIKESKES